MLLINADDWGSDQLITDRIARCYELNRIHAGSAMVFMKDSERAAELAAQIGLPVGLHLNLNHPFDGQNVPRDLRMHHQRVVTYLCARKMNQILYNPFLRKAFEYVFFAQWEEFCRLYGRSPSRLDGHSHMHLCSNMLFSNKYPRGVKIRKNYSFNGTEKGLMKIFYRRVIDRWLSSRFNCADLFFSIEPFDEQRLARIISLSMSHDVEIMVHTDSGQEFDYLLSDEWLSLLNQYDYLKSEQLRKGLCV